MIDPSLKKMAQKRVQWKRKTTPYGWEMPIRVEAISVDEPLMNLQVKGKTTRGLNIGKVGCHILHSTLQGMHVAEDQNALWEDIFVHY